MRDNGAEIFLLGLVIGIVFLAGVLIMSGATPVAERKRWEIEAFKRGYGEMIVKDDKIEFQWKEQP